MEGAIQKSDIFCIAPGGPCPPRGTHRYYLRIYALGIRLNSKAGATKAGLIENMKGHIPVEGQLMGKYKRKG